ncbi:hypothetical protein [Chitinophaga parva]|nr:hypothetical protein [Chitinophaga parva]
MNIRSLTMRWLTFILILIAGVQHANAQYVYKIKADTVRIYNTCDTAELVLQNRTQNVLGYLYNKGGGVTEFRALGAVDSMYRRNDTLFYHTADGKTIPVKMDLTSVYDLKSTNYITINAGDSANYGKLPLQKVVGIGAYSATDMPPLSSQAFQGVGNKTYYQGLAVSDGSRGVNLMVNWDGELNGPNGAFLRTKDDTKTTWSNWRELVFKDYADSIYGRASSASDYVNRTASASEPSAIPAFTGNLNTVANTSISLISQSAINTPASRTGILFSGSDNSIIGGAKFQLYGGVSQNDDLWIRYGGGGTWNSWYQMASRAWTNASFAPVNMPLSSVLTNGNTANHSIILGAVGNTNQYIFQLLKNVSGNDYSASLSISSIGQAVLNSRLSSDLTTTSLISLLPGSAAPLYSSNNGATLYSMWHAGNDGAGSGLDADLLDGQDASKFISNQGTVAQIASFWVSGFGAAATLNTGAATGVIQFSTNNGSYATNGSGHRWSIYHSGTESGTSIGNDFNIGRYDNTGSFLSSTLTIQRSTGNIGIATQSPSERLEINGNIKTSGTFFFNRLLSDANLLADFQQGYQLYSDTVGALAPNGTRVWLAGPDKGSVVFGPRAGPSYLNVIRMKADTFRLEGNGSRWKGIASLGTDAYGNLANTTGSFIQNQNTTIQGNASYVISGRGTSQSIGTFQAAAGPPHWVLFNGSNANTAVRWSVSMKNTESTNDNGADFTIDRYDSTGAIIDNVFFAKRSTGFIGMGTSSPVQKLDVNGGVKANSLVTYGGGTSTATYGHYYLGSAAGLGRWRLGIKGLETGSGNVGSDLDISPYTDAGNVNTSVSAFTIQRSTGNVGINNASPSQKLDVNGSIYASASVITPTVAAPTASSDLTLQAGTGSAVNVNSMLRVSNSVQLPQKIVSASYTLTGNDYTIFCSASSTTLTLPAASSASGRVYEIVNASSGSVIISAVQVYATATTSIPTNTSWRI